MINQQWRSLFAFLLLIPLGTDLHSAITALGVNFHDTPDHLIPQDASNTAGVVSAGFWNSSTQAGLDTAMTSDGISHPINVSFTLPPNVDFLPHTQIGAPANNDERLMGGSFDLHAASLTLGVSGLPQVFSSRGYDVYVYLWGTDNALEQGQYQVALDLGQDNIDDGIPTVFFVQNLPTFSSFDNSGQTTNAVNAASANYVKIARFGPGQSSFDLDITATDWVVINGFQVVAVPEPAMALFLVSGSAATLAQRRRRFVGIR